MKQILGIHRSPHAHWVGDGFPVRSLFTYDNLASRISPFLLPDYAGNALSVKRDGVRWFTPLFAVLILIAVTDVIFAVDSIPAIFAITTDPFIVLTSNVFAVLGLRAMFFLLAGMADRFHLLPYGLALVLAFIGIKMMIIDLFKIPTPVSLGVVAVIIAATVVLSLKYPPKEGSGHA